MTSRFTELVIDCADPERVASFWIAVLDYRVTERNNDLVFIEGPEGSGPGLAFQKVPEPKTVKNRVHLDLIVGPEAHDTEVQRLVGLGAAVLGAHEGDEGSWTLLADPEGNEFDVS